MKKKSTVLFAIALLTIFITTFLLANWRSTRVLGNSRLQGSRLTVRILQERAPLAAYGIGPSRITFALVDPEGIWVQTQDIPTFKFNKEEWQWAQWEAPETLPLEGNGELRTLPIVLKFPAGHVVKRDVVVSGVPQGTADGVH